MRIWLGVCSLVAALTCVSLLVLYDWHDADAGQDNATGPVCAPIRGDVTERQEDAERVGVEERLTPHHAPEESIELNSLNDGTGLVLKDVISDSSCRMLVRSHGGQSIALLSKREPSGASFVAVKGTRVFARSSLPRCATRRQEHAHQDELQTLRRLYRPA